MGSRGSMGQRICDTLRKKGIKTIECGRDFGSLGEAAQCDFVVISVPIPETPAIITRIAPLMKKGSLLCDICSVKSHLKGSFELAKRFGIEILSLHPLFGPQREFIGSRAAFIKIKPGEKSEKVIRFLNSLGLEAFETTIDEHDRSVAVTQGLFHFFITELDKISDPRFHTTNFCAVKRLDKKLISEMLQFNPFFPAAKKRFLSEPSIAAE